MEVIDKQSTAFEDNSKVKESDKSETVQNSSEKPAEVSNVQGTTTVEAAETDSIDKPIYSTEKVLRDTIDQLSDKKLKRSDNMLKLSEICAKLLEIEKDLDLSETQIDQPTSSTIQHANDVKDASLPKINDSTKRENCSPEIRSDFIPISKAESPYISEVSRIFGDECPKLSSTYTFKLIVIGNVGVGKTSLIKRYTEESFYGNYHATIGVDFYNKTLYHEHGHIFLRIHDIAGQDRNVRLSRVFYRQANGVLFCYDVAEPSSLESIIEWKKIFDENVAEEVGLEVPRILIGNKSDIPRQFEKNHREDMINFAEENGFVAWYEVSAKTGENVDEAFNLLAHLMVLRNDKINKIGLDPQTVRELQLKASKMDMINDGIKEIGTEPDSLRELRLSASGMHSPKCSIGNCF